MQNAQLSDVVVRMLFKHCEITPADGPTEFLVSAMSRSHLHPMRVERQRARIELLLAQLPDSFRRPPHGDSIFNAHADRDGKVWIRESEELSHRLYILDRLLHLGIAIGRIGYLTPHREWNDNPNVVLRFGVVSDAFPASMWKDPPRPQIIRNAAPQLALVR